MDQNLESTYQDQRQVTAPQALAQARAANLATRRRWPAVQSAVAQLCAVRPDADRPSQARTA